MQNIYVFAFQEIFKFSSLFFWQLGTYWSFAFCKVLESWQNELYPDKCINNAETNFNHMKYLHKHRHTVYRYAHLFEYRATCLYLLQYALQLVVINTSILKVPVIDGSMLLFIYWPPDISSELINTSILNKVSVIDRSMLDPWTLALN